MTADDVSHPIFVSLYVLNVNGVCLWHTLQHNAHPIQYESANAPTLERIIDICVGDLFADAEHQISALRGVELMRTRRLYGRIFTNMPNKMNKRKTPNRRVSNNSMLLFAHRLRLRHGMIALQTKQTRLVQYKIKNPGFEQIWRWWRCCPMECSTNKCESYICLCIRLNFSEYVFFLHEQIIVSMVFQRVLLPRPDNVDNNTWWMKFRVYRVTIQHTLFK